MLIAGHVLAIRRAAREMNVENRYAKLASWVYDLDKPVGRSFGDVEYYLGRLTACDGPVLEPATGNGRILVPLLEAGFDVSGFDASAEMLGYCQKALDDRGLEADLTKQDFESFSYDKRFAAIIMPAGSFQLVTDTRAAIQLLKRFHHHLLADGRLIIDIDPIDGFLGPSGSIRSWTTPEGDLLTLRDDRIETNYIRQTTLTHLRYEHWSDGNLLGAELDLFKLRWWGIAELHMAMEAAGFSDIVISTDYRHGQMSEGSASSITFEARRDSSASI